MHTDPTHVRPHKPRHLAEKFEGMLGIAMLVAIVILAIGLIWGLTQSGTGTPTWMR